MMFAAPTAGCVLACVVSDCAIQETPRALVTAYHVFGLLTLRQVNMGFEKIFFTFDFHILT